MPVDFTQQYEIIYNYFLKSPYAKMHGSSQTGLSKLLDVSRGACQAWEKGTFPTIKHIHKIHELFGFEYNFLCGGQGRHFAEKEGEDASPQKQQPQAIPARGFASCGIEGWGGQMTFQVPVNIPQWHDKMIAVIATGESMIPAGIGNMQTCFCDPTLKPVIGEAVFIEMTNNSGALKLFLGTDEEAGHGTKKGEVCLRGWLDKEKDMPAQKDFILRIKKEFIKQIAPVIFVKRRL